ncbi:MAG: alkaline phosphatase PhoX [Gammaproteobacteria bacterium]
MPGQDSHPDRKRRALFKAILASSAALVPGFGWRRLLADSTALSTASPYGSLLPADDHGIRLPRGFSARLLALSGKPVAATDYVWPYAPDGAGVFAAPNGWVLVCNAELNAGQGGASALRFSSRGEIIDAYAVLSGTTRNCAGGTTPWGTWLSCEEFADGQVWECDPLGQAAATVRPALGRFAHEAAAVDPQTGHVYLTEDDMHGRLYRFCPDKQADLSSGRLEVAAVDAGRVQWLAASAERPYRGDDAAIFHRGEGAWLDVRTLYFTTTADHRVWALDVDNGQLELRYDGVAAGTAGALREPDNITVHAGHGSLFVAEDSDDLQLVLLTGRNGRQVVAPFLQLVGHNQSELTGPVFSPDGQRLYFSSQRGRDGRGMSFEISGPF